MDISATSLVVSVDFLGAVAMGSSLFLLSVVLLMSKSGKDGEVAG